MEWPEYFPKSCPPKEAVYIQPSIYRLVSKHTPKKGDFIPYFISQKKDWGKKACQACGLSVHETLEDCRNNYDRLKRRIPSMRKKIAIAKGEKIEGKFLNTPSKEDSTHCTWWIPKILEKPWELFEVIDSPSRSD